MIIFPGAAVVVGARWTCLRGGEGLVGREGKGREGRTERELSSSPRTVLHRPSRPSLSCLVVPPVPTGALCVLWGPCCVEEEEGEGGRGKVIGEDEGREGDIAET
jgi:hypothetical protein